MICITSRWVISSFATSCSIFTANGLSMRSSGGIWGLLICCRDFCLYSPGRGIWGGMVRSGGAGRVGGVVFGLLLPCLLSGGDWVLGYVSTEIWDLRDISLFPKILSLKSFGNSWGNSCTKFAILDTTFVLLVVNRISTKTL